MGKRKDKDSKKPERRRLELLESLTQRWYESTNLVRFVLFLLFVSVLIFGVYLRFDDKIDWDRNVAFFYLNGEPLFSEYDSFYFARLAKDIEEGLFESGRVDRFRFYPEYRVERETDSEDFAPKYSVSGHLVSYLFYLLSGLTGLSISWLTYYLVPLFSVSVAIPLYLYFKRLDLPMVGILGALVGVSSMAYLQRTSFMRLDHDFFNLTLPFLVAYFFLRFFQSESLKGKYLYITLSSLTLLLYFLWYGHSNLNFVLLMSFFIAYLWNPLKCYLLKQPIEPKFSKHDLIFLVILILPQIWYIHYGPLGLITQVKNLVLGIKAPVASERLFSEFPNILMSISELQRKDFSSALSIVITNKFLGVVGLIGAVLMFIVRFRDLIFLLPFFGIGLLVFISGLRFGMYLAPFVGLGIGFVIYLIFEVFLSRILKVRALTKVLSLSVGFAVFVILIYSQTKVMTHFSPPVLSSALAKEMAHIKQTTPENAAIWTWWDYGYVYQHLSRRTVFIDGGTQATPKTYFVARSFTTADPREGWLITSYIANHGLTGIYRALKAGVSAKQLLEAIKAGHYEKPLNSPVYWIFTQDMISKFGWIQYFGSFNFERKEGVFGSIFTTLCRGKSSDRVDHLECANLPGDFVLDTERGIIRQGGQTAQLKEIFIREGNRGIKRSYHERGLYVFLNRFSDSEMLLAIAQPHSAETLFYKMFFLKEYDSQYFELVHDAFPVMVIYRVRER